MHRRIHQKSPVIPEPSSIPRSFVPRVTLLHSPISRPPCASLSPVHVCLLTYTPSPCVLACAPSPASSIVPASLLIHRPRACLLEMGIHPRSRTTRGAHPRTKNHEPKQKKYQVNVHSKLIIQVSAFSCPNLLCSHIVLPP